MSTCQTPSPTKRTKLSHAETRAGSVQPGDSGLMTPVSFSLPRVALTSTRCEASPVMNSEPLTVSRPGLEQAAFSAIDRWF